MYQKQIKWNLSKLNALGVQIKQILSQKMRKTSLDFMIHLNWFPVY